MNEDELNSLLEIVAESSSDSMRQALLWLIDSRRMWRRRALDAEAELAESAWARDTVG